MEREDAFDPLAERDLADGEGGLDAAAALGDDVAAEDLDALFVALDDLGVYPDGVADVELGAVFPKLFLFDFIKCLK